MSEVVKKHLYEREAMIQMLQGRESAVRKADAKSMTREERSKGLKVLRNQHRNWKNSSSADQEVIQRILIEGTWSGCIIIVNRILFVAFYALP